MIRVGTLALALSAIAIQAQDPPKLDKVPAIMKVAMVTRRTLAPAMNCWRKYRAAPRSCATSMCKTRPASSASACRSVTFRV